MKKLLISALAVTVGLALAPAGLAAAETDDPTVESRGWLAAKGTGSVEIDMGGRLGLRVDGDVILTDHAGDMRFSVNGGEERSAEAAESGLDVVLNDFAGAVRVRGSDFSILVGGEFMLMAHGRGQAWLEGTSLYKTRYGDVHVCDGMAEIAGTEVAPVNLAA
jgi:hypothetical protein